MTLAHLWNTLVWSAAEIPVAVTLAAAEMGLRQEQAERLGDLVMMFWATGPNELLAENGAPELLLPHPEAWRRQVNWPAAFDRDGMSAVAGQIAAASRAELEAEEAGTAEVERPE
jgi:hypothetical protein